MQHKTRDIFISNILKYRLESDKLSRILNRLSMARVSVFISGVILIILFANQRLIAFVLITTIIFLAIFILLVINHNRYSFRRKHIFFLKKINESEILRLENSLSGFDSGKVYIKNDHPYCTDLDVFGTHSLYQLVNRTTTGPGSDRLAAWLLNPAPGKVIVARQDAIKELNPQLDWRQELQATGMHFENKGSDFSTLQDWIKKPERLLPAKLKYLSLAMMLGVSFSITLILFFTHIGSEAFYFYLPPFLLLSFINYYILNRLNPVADEIAENLSANIKTLEAFRLIFRKIEAGNFKSAALKELQSGLTVKGKTASEEIDKLLKVLEFFFQRGVKKESIMGNAFYWIMNYLWLSDIYFILLTEQWKLKNKDHVPVWADALSELEALASLAGFSFANPDYVSPEIKKESFMIRFKTLGHPLIDPVKRIKNDFELSGRGKIAMITGSNMAGKSTFLRTVGVNLILAYMGAPCCAMEAAVSQFKMFTSMRTQDNLEEGISSFYAELRKIEALFKLTDTGEPVFFLLDEMFKGTNSEDRHKGGYSLIRQLENLNASGIISTHDLELAKIFQSKNGVINYSFNSVIRDHEITFDYKLTDGVCTDFNASELMRRSGIKIIEE